MNIDFLLISMVVILLPGTGVLYTLAVGIGRGFRASVFAAFGCTLGIVPAASASIVGLSALLHTSAMGYQVVRYLGVAWLFYMAWNILRAGGALDVDTLDTPNKNRSISAHLKTVRDGFLINVLNPKLSLFFLAFLPQFVTPEQANSNAALVWLAFVFMFLTFVVFVGYGACASVARDYVIRKPTVLMWLRRVFAAAFGFLGAKLAFY